jgi:hydrogenase expression/formation protein HypC
MCIGLPMRIVETDGVSALVEGQGIRRRISLLLVGELPVGAAVLVHLDTAMRLLSEDEVQLVEAALAAADAAARGESWEHLLADLIHRTPQLPPHLSGAPPGPEESLP